MSGKRVLLLRLGPDPDAAHERAVSALKGAVPDLRWISSYRTQGPYDAIDVVDFQPGEDPEAARRALEEAGIEAEWLPAEASPTLRAPGGPGGAPGGAPGGGPGGPPGGAPGGAPGGPA